MPLWRFEAIGTVWEIASSASISQSLRDAVTAEISSFDREWSRFRVDSVVMRLGREPGTVSAPVDTAVMLNLYRELSEATGGAVNPLVGDCLVAVGYDSALTFSTAEPAPAPADWGTQLQWSDDALALHSHSTIDVGAVGKGRLVDRVLAVLAPLQGSVVVDASGDMAIRGDAVRVALEHPFDSTKAIGVVTIRDAALCASATNRRAWGDGLHHVLDARTGIPVRTWAATWAIAPDAMRADAIATALFFEGGAQLAESWGVEWVRMATDGRVERSSGSRVELFTARRG